MTISRAIKSGKLKVSSKGKINPESKEAIVFLELAEKQNQKKNLDKAFDSVVAKIPKKNNKKPIKGYPVSEASLANLSQPGHTNNPNGRPKGKTFSTLLNELMASDKKTLENHFGIKLIDGVTIQAEIVKKMVYLALNGNETMLKYIFDRMEGKPAQMIIAAAKNLDQIIINITNEEQDY